MIALLAYVDYLRMKCLLQYHVFFKNSGGNGVSPTKLDVLTVPKNDSEFRCSVGNASARIRPHIYLCSPASSITTYMEDCLGECQTVC